MSPQDFSHLNQSKFQGQNDYDRRSSIERADIDKMIKKHQGSGVQQTISPRYDKKSVKTQRS